jgi:undecaprenyl-diphosphatase
MKKFLYSLALILFSVGSHSQSADLTMLGSINAKEYPCWDKTMKGVSFSVYPVMPVAVGGIWIHGHIGKDKTLKRNAFKSALAIGLASGISTGLKYAVNRTRPFTAYPDVIIQRDHVGPYSFPSGHTTVAFATATSVSLTYRKWYAVVPAYLYAGMIGYSRMRLGVHYPSDVLGGIIIGTGAGFLTWKLDKMIKRKNK